MNTKPIIGIAPNYSYEKKEYTLSEDYVLAIEKAGGCPIVLLPHQALPPFLDGLLLTGGGALLKGLDQLLREQTSLPITVVDDPLSTVVMGTGRALDNIHVLKDVCID